LAYVSSRGLLITYRSSKRALPYGDFPATCPVQLLVAWLGAADIVSGPIYRTITPQGVLTSNRASDQIIHRAIKTAAKLAGLDPSDYSAHSLRRGFMAGKHEAQI
jgi:hypothetical protein